MLGNVQWADARVTWLSTPRDQKQEQYLAAKQLDLVPQQIESLGRASIQYMGGWIDLNIIYFHEYIAHSMRTNITTWQT